MSAIISVIFFVALILRLAPIRLSKSNLGVDHWFWKLYIEEYRKVRKLPPNLPQYILDSQQWYPPLFPFLIINVPKAIFEKRAYFISILVDLLRMALLLFVLYYSTHANIYAILIGGIIYATTPILISYNTQLNPRGLGALLLDIVLILFIWRYFFEGPFWVPAAIVILSSGILVTHKMTTQLFWFICITASVVLHDWKIFMLIPLSILAALIFSGGFYAKVLLAHWDIVAFWARNWKWLQANPVLESPVYGNPNYETPAKFYQKGVKGLFKHIMCLVGYSPASWILIIILISRMFVNAYCVKGIAFAVYIFIVMTVFAVSTILVPFMRCLGSGYFYTYNSSFWVALLYGIVVFANANSRILYILLFISIAMSVLSIITFYVKIMKERNRNDNFEKILKYMIDLPEGLIFCLPLQLSDMVAYRTRYPVLSGGHGYGFKLFEEVFPRIKLPFEEMKNKYGIRYFLAKENYLTDKLREDIKAKNIVRFDDYNLFILS